MRPELYHRSLLKLHEDLAKMQKNIDSKLTSLKAYHDLPPVCNIVVH